MKTRLFKYTENFTCKNWKFSDKKKKKKKKKKKEQQQKTPDIFHIFAQNIDYGYP